MAIQATTVRDNLVTEINTAESALTGAETPAQIRTAMMLGFAEGLLPWLGVTQFDTQTGVEPVYFTRDGVTTDEFLSISVLDTEAQWHYNNDNLAATLKWTIENTDDLNAGAGANTNILTFYGDGADPYLALNGNRFWHQGTFDPTTKSDVGHTHVKADITDFAHTHTRSEITDFAHTHTRSEITDFAHTHTRSEITDFAHTHTKSEITDFAHTHDSSDITGTIDSDTLGGLSSSQFLRSDAADTLDAALTVGATGKITFSATDSLVLSGVDNLQFTGFSGAGTAVYVHGSGGGGDNILAIVEQGLSDYDLQVFDGGTAYTVWHGGNFDPTTKSDVGHTHVKADITDFAHTHDAADVTSGTFADARIAASNVTQHVTKTYVDGLNVDADTLDNYNSSDFIRFTQGVGYNDLHKAQGSVTTSNYYSVHQYAFGSPYINEDTGAYVQVRPFENPNGAGRHWQTDDANSGGVNGRSANVTWDYLTASGEPVEWAWIDGSGNIIGMWEAEDPADPEFPDEPPMGPMTDNNGNELTGLTLVKLQPMPEARFLQIVNRADLLDMPTWIDQSIYKGYATPKDVLRAMVNRYIESRFLEDPGDIRAIFTDISDPQRRHWYQMLFLRQFTRLEKNSKALTHIPLAKDMFKVSPAGVITFK